MPILIAGSGIMFDRLFKAVQVESKRARSVPTQEASARAARLVTNAPQLTKPSSLSNEQQQQAAQSKVLTSIPQAIKELQQSPAQFKEARSTAPAKAASLNDIFSELIDEQSKFGLSVL